jgi:chromate reductase, NAD(P)H dehydrogenase (quinone)
MHINILGFAGSLRKGSYNRALLRVASELAPPDTSLEIFDLEGIPPFNQDLETSMPRKVAEFKQKIKSADALLIVSPEHNYSVPGVLKNAIDWASRPYGDNSFKGKSVAVMSASTGMLGGARAQYHLRQIFVFLDMHPINKPEVFITLAAQKFDNEGKLLDEKARELIRDLLKSLVDWTIRITEKPN